MFRTTLLATAAALALTAPAHADLLNFSFADALGGVYAKGPQGCTIETVDGDVPVACGDVDTARSFSPPDPEPARQPDNGGETDGGDNGGDQCGRY